MKIIKTRKVELFTLLILLLPSHFLDGNEQQGSVISDSFISSTILSPENYNLIQDETFAVPDATFVRAPRGPRRMDVNRQEQKWIAREVYLERDIRDINAINPPFVQKYAIVPETVQIRDYKKKRKVLFKS